MNWFSLRICCAAAALTSSLGCGEPDGAAASAESAPAEAATERGAQREQSSTDSETELAAPATQLVPNAAGCAGTCAQVCDCLAAACQRDGAGSCAALAEDCRSSCSRSTCTAGDAQCWRTPAPEQGLPPDDPEPTPPGPGPDPSPVDSSSGNGSGSNASSSGSSASGSSASSGGSSRGSGASRPGSGY